jgi:hypothetical protein
MFSTAIRFLMPNSCFTSPAPAHHRLLRFLLLLALLGGCRSERVAFQFQAPLKMPLGMNDSAAFKGFISVPLAAGIASVVDAPIQLSPQQLVSHAIPSKGIILRIKPVNLLPGILKTMPHQQSKQTARIGQTAHETAAASAFHSQKPTYSGPSDEAVIFFLVLSILAVFVGFPLLFSSLLSIGYGEALLLTFGALLVAILLIAVISSIVNNLTDRYYGRNTT